MTASSTVQSNLNLNLNNLNIIMSLLCEQNRISFSKLFNNTQAVRRKREMTPRAYFYNSLTNLKDNNVEQN